MLMVIDGLPKLLQVSKEMFYIIRIQRATKVLTKFGVIVQRNLNDV